VTLPTTLGKRQIGVTPLTNVAKIIMHLSTTSALKPVLEFPPQQTQRIGSPTTPTKCATVYVTWTISSNQVHLLLRGQQVQVMWEDHRSILTSVVDYCPILGRLYILMQLLVVRMLTVIRIMITVRFNQLMD
jgi:hypothetical protein